MLAIIGGTGLYQLPGLVLQATHDSTTPFGDASAPVQQGLLNGQPLLFLPRHGAGHRLLPHEVNYRANIFALKRAGATMVLSVSACGSLAEDLAPGHFALPHQYIDWTRGARERSFFGRGVAAHVATAEPVSRALCSAVVAAAAQVPGLVLHEGGTYACVEGPRFGTRAESFMLRQFGARLVGMTNVPEVFLAREAQMAYATLAIATDYDCWRDDPNEHASMDAVLARYAGCLDQARALIGALLAVPLPAPEPAIRRALAGAVMTADAVLSPEQRDWLAVLRA
ncbi:MAG: MTAP family purine nucleoside phosphorylase [Rubrivivax sp.]|nr:MTAP family purine nucleoside phosphorylase [Rubrivivax sp.]